MLSRTTEMFVVGALIFYLAFGSGLSVVRDLLSTSVGKAVALAGIVYVHQKVSCSIALLLVVWYVRCARTSWEGFTTPTTTVEPTMTCPSGYALDAVTKTCRVSSSMSGSIPPAPTGGSEMGASVSTPPPNSALSTAPMTTPMPTMPPVMPPMTMGGVQPATGTSSSSAGV